MSILSRALLVLFIANTITLGTRAAAEKFEGLWLMAILSIVSAILFIALGSPEEKIPRHNLP